MHGGRRDEREAAETLSRRAFVALGVPAALGAAIYLTCKSSRVSAKSIDQTPKNVKIVTFSDAGQRLDVVIVPTIVKSEAEWRRQLPPEAFTVARRAGTERAYSGQYWNLHEKGLYRCICCDTALFSSETKFDSGTGWPSFWQPIAKENINEADDDSLGMMRTAVSCRRCDGHLGHVFDDGPRPTGLRYCMNSVSLRFVKLVQSDPSNFK